MYFIPQEPLPLELFTIQFLSSSGGGWVVDESWGLQVHHYVKQQITFTPICCYAHYFTNTTHLQIYKGEVKLIRRETWWGNLFPVWDHWLPALCLLKVITEAENRALCAEGRGPWWTWAGLQIQFAPKLVGRIYKAPSRDFQLHNTLSRSPFPFCFS